MEKDTTALCVHAYTEEKCEELIDTTALYVHA
jgi:hypothetical protein